VKRDAVVVKVTTEDGLVGWGESHHGRAHTAVAKLIETTLKQLVLGMDAADAVGVWARIYKFQLGSHGMGAGCAMAMSGLDMALWDIRAKAAGWPLHRLLGGAAKPVPPTRAAWRWATSRPTSWWRRRGRMSRPATGR
jgi:L-alanine-DL-glutamate epimerase-like enolase superfamily enzyme